MTDIKRLDVLSGLFFVNVPMFVDSLIRLWDLSLMCRRKIEQQSPPTCFLDGPFSANCEIMRLQVDRGKIRGGQSGRPQTLGRYFFLVSNL